MSDLVHISTLLHETMYQLCGIKHKHRKCNRYPRKMKKKLGQHIISYLNSIGG